MKNSGMQIKFITLLATLTTFWVNACEFHAGFGFGVQHFTPPPQMLAKPKLLLKVPPMIDASDSPLVKTQIEFERPDEIQDASLQVASSSKIAISSQSSTLLTNNAGSIPLEFEVLESGYHVLTVRVTGINEGEPVSYSRRMIVRLN